MPSQTHLPESPLIPKPSVSRLKTSAPMEVPPPKEPGEMVGSKKPESSSQTGKMPEQSSPPNQLTVHLPGVAVCPDHQVTLRTLLLPSDTVYNLFKLLGLETWLLSFFFLYLIVFVGVSFFS